MARGTVSRDTAQGGGGQVVGVVLAGAGAISYAFTILFGRVLAKADLGAPTALGVRFGLAALILFAGLAASGRSPLPAPGERVAAFLLGAVGYTVESTFFFMGLERGSAAAVALLFYAYPAIVTLLDVAFGAARPRRSTLIALALAATGTGLVVASAEDVAISTSGVVFSLASAATFAVYLLAGHRLAPRSDPPALAAWVAGGASLSLLGRGLVAGDLRSPAGAWPELFAYGLATSLAFWLTFAALRRLGPAPTAVVMTLEAFFAILLAALFLDEGIGWVQVVGGTAILGAAALIGVASAGRPGVEPVAAAEPLP